MRIESEESMVQSSLQDLRHSPPATVKVLFIHQLVEWAEQWLFPLQHLPVLAVERERPACGMDGVPLLQHGDESLSDVVRVVGFGVPKDGRVALPMDGCPGHLQLSPERIGTVPNNKVVSAVFLPVQL